MRNIYAIWDKVAMAQYGALVMQAHDGPVCRLFYDLLADKDQPMSRHPADYDLLCVGTITDECQVTGGVVRAVATGEAYVAERMAEA